MQDRLALDRASVRVVDPTSGHLHVADSAISRANVCPYFGREIPDFEALGLDAGRTYQLLRDPAALEASAASFNGKPLLIIHRAQNAADHDPELVIGAVNNVRWVAPFLRAELVVWDGDAIKLIEDGTQRELSCGYFYQAVMEPGTFEGTAFDGRMLNITGNHVALVPEGRVEGAFVGDAAPPKPKQETKFMAAKAPATHRAALLASGAVRAYLAPKLAQDAKVDLTAALKGVTAKKWKSGKPALVKAINAATKDKLAADADIADVVELLDQLDDAVEEVADTDDMTPVDDDMEDMSMDDDMAAKVRTILGPDADEEKVKALCAMMAPAAKDAEPAKKPEPPKAPEITKAAMDAAIAVAVRKAASDAEASTVARMNAIADAKRLVQPHVGEIATAMDSAAAVFKMALDNAAIDLTDVPETAYAAMVRMLPLPGSEAKPAKPRLAHDAAAAKGFSERFPSAAPLRSL